MDLSEIEKFETPAKTLKLSEAIRAGIGVVVETRDYCGCAMGAAYTFITGRNLMADKSLPENVAAVGSECGYAVVAKMFGVPVHVAEVASTKHLYGEWTREQCARYLEVLGY